VGDGGKKKTCMRYMTAEECEAVRIAFHIVPPFPFFLLPLSFFLLQPLYSLMQAEAACDPRDLDRPHCWHVRGNEEGGKEQQRRN